MSYTTLISTNELVAHLGAPGVRIVDCRFSLADKTAGCVAYKAAHIPGAVYANLDEDLSAPRAANGAGGRHPLPTPEAFATILSDLGNRQRDPGDRLRRWLRRDGCSPLVDVALAGP